MDDETDPTTEVTVVVDTSTPEPDPEPDPAPVVVVVADEPPIENVGDQIDRWVDVEQRFSSMESRLAEHDQLIMELTVHDIIEDALDEPDPVVDEVIETDPEPTEDEIEPRRTHWWFKSMSEWFS